LATNVVAENYDLEQSGVFEILVFPRPGASLSLIESLVDSTIAAIAANGVTAAELERFNNYNDVLGTTSLQTRLARADTLAHDQVFAGDPLAYARQAAASHRLTSADVRRVARQYLGKGRVVMSLVPAGKIDLVSKPELPYTNVTPLWAVRSTTVP
jgi:zinc protease